MTNQSPVHPLKGKARILLSSVFGPYAQNDEFGSRKINPMELYQNQVTRIQGAFSLRMFHRSFGPMLIQANIDAPTTLLDFPNKERFTEELKTHTYDIIGISAILPNISKVKEMCRLIRKHQPAATIVVGGHIANYEHAKRDINADYVVKGEGVRWFRKFLGQDENAKIKHPAVYSGFGARIMGLDLKESPKNTAAILLPSVGCPLGCNFCSTSAFFGGKGKSVHFYETGDELFEVMSGIEKKLGVRSFFALDENFLFYRERVLRLLELMKEHNKSWSIYIFSSARVLRSYTMEQLLGLGISWVWVGLEGKESQYAKLNNIDTKDLVDELQSNGIRVLGSSIIGMEDHTPENIREVIEYAVSHKTVFHQFMLYTPNSGTPLHAEMKEKGVLLPLEEISHADSHGQDRFNFRHDFIKNGEEKQFLLDAFHRDYEVNGPSIARLFRVTMNGFMKHKNHPDKRVRRRIRHEASELKASYAAAAWAIRKRYPKGSPVRAELDQLMNDIYKEFGWKVRIIAPLGGLLVAKNIRKEEKRLESGWTYEPKTFYQKNHAAHVLSRNSKKASQSIIDTTANLIVDYSNKKRKTKAHNPS